MTDAVKIHVDQLRVGMYISRLDKEWLDTPFLMQGFAIEDSEDIAIVAEYCDYVWVDTSRKPKLSTHSANPASASFAPINHYEYQNSVEEEHQKVYKAFKQARAVTKDLLDDIRLGSALDATDAKQIVDDCVQSVLRHPDALLWMAKIREESEYTSDHCLNVCILAISFGRQLGMDDDELQKLGLCGLLHDIGKMRVPSEILHKPGKLTEKENILMKSHTVHGRNLLLAAKNIYSGAIDVAYSHHERADGTGYPRKLVGSSTSYFARIIAIVDAYDAMTAKRCYSGAITSTEALKRIYEDRGKHFDEKLAIQFIKVIGLFPSGSIVELYTGEVGIVIETNPGRRHLPRIIIVRDENKEKVQKERIVNLSLVESNELPKSNLIKKVWPEGSFDIYIKEYHEKGLIFPL